MNAAKRYVATGLLAVLATPLMAVEISVGGTPITIPSPAGFVPVTEDMQPFEEISRRFVAPINVQLAQFISEPEAAMAARAEMPGAERRCYVQTLKEMAGKTVSKDLFEQLKRAVKTENENILKKAGAEIPGLLEKISRGLGEDFDSQVDLALSQALPLPPHMETDRSLAFSALLKYDLTDESGKPAVYEGVVTTTFVHLKGRVLFLYVNAEKGGLQWSRTVSKNWAAQLVQANPSTGTFAELEARPSRSGFNWSSVVRSAIIGGAIGGLFALFGALKKKRQS